MHLSSILDVSARVGLVGSKISSTLRLYNEPAVPLMGRTCVEHTLGRLPVGGHLKTRRRYRDGVFESSWVYSKFNSPAGKPSVPLASFCPE